MRISIALATFNGERFLHEQLDSLHRQTFLPCELVICDDGSSDCTLKIIEDFARTSPFPVRVYRNDKRLGFADNFLKTASLCRGELIAFCDQDDVWLPSKLQRCAAPFSDPETVLTVHRAKIVNAELEPMGAYQGVIERAQVINSACWEPWLNELGFSMIFRRELISRYRWYERPLDFRHPGELMTHDLWIMFLARATGKIRFMPDVLSLYRQHSSNTCGAPQKGLVRAVQSAAKTGYLSYLHRCEMALVYAKYLEEAAMGHDMASGMRLREGAATYREQAIYYRERASLYNPEARSPRKLLSLIKLILQAAYQPRSRGGLGLRSFVKDFIVGISRAPREISG